MAHLDRELLAAVARGDTSPQALVEVAWNHLLQICPTCRREVAAWRRTAEPVDYREAFSRLQAGLRADGEQVARQRAEARRWLAALLPLPQEERRARVARSRRRFRGRAFAETLLAEARDRLSGRPGEAGELAELVQEAAFRSTLPAGEGPALAAQALALQGEARRALGRPEEADDLLDAARRLLAESPATDPLVAAEVDYLEGLLRRDQRRFREAEALLQRAALLYRVLGEVVAAARALLALAGLYEREGLADRAVGATLRAQSDLDPEAEPALYLEARFAHATHLHGAGRHRQAVATLVADADRYEAAGDPDLGVRVRWLQGRLAAALDDPGEAAEAFAEVRAWFAEAGEAFSHAAAGLDLALLHLRAGRWEAVREVAAETVAHFGAHGTGPEVLAALVLFRQGAEEEALTAAWVEELARYLERARTDPAARFEEPS